MSVGSIGSSSASAINQLALQALGRPNDGDSDGVQALSQAGASVQVSPAGDLFQQLAALQKSDPEKLKAALAQAAQQLHAAAAQATGQQGQFLGKLADKFDAAAQSGDLSQLQPARGAQARSAYGDATAADPSTALQSASGTGAAQEGQKAHHHHHHHGGGGGAGQQGSGSSSASAGGVDPQAVLSQVFEQLKAAVAPPATSSS